MWVLPPGLLPRRSADQTNCRGCRPAIGQAVRRPAIGPRPAAACFGPIFPTKQGLTIVRNRRASLAATGWIVRQLQAGGRGRSAGGPGQAREIPGKLRGPGRSRAKVLVFMQISFAGALLWRGVAGLTLWRRSRRLNMTRQIGYGGPAAHEDMMTWKFPAASNAARVARRRSPSSLSIRCDTGQRAAQARNMTTAAVPITARAVPTCPISRGRAPGSTSPSARGSTPASKCCPATANSTTTRFRRRSGTRRSARENNNRPIDRQPLNPPSDLGGYPRSASRCIDCERLRQCENARLRAGHFLYATRR